MGIMFLLKLTPYEIVIIVLAWLILVVGTPVALKLAIKRLRRRWQARKRGTAAVAPAPPKPRGSG
jgi:hypothetical protein